MRNPITLLVIFSYFLIHTETVCGGRQDQALGPELIRGVERVAPDVEVVHLEGCSHWVQQDRQRAHYAQILAGQGKLGLQQDRPEEVNALMHRVSLQARGG